MSQAVVSVFLAITAVIALIGNTLVVILFVRNRQWLKKAHTCLLLTLAVQDILTAVSLLVIPGLVQPFDVYTPPSDSALSQLYCSLIWSRYIPFALAIASVYTCLMLTIERWSAALKPVSYRRFSHSARVIAVMVIFPWLAGIGLEVSAILNVNSNEVNGTFVCSWSVTESSSKKTIGALFTFFGMILVPAILITIAYVQIVCKLRQTSSRVLPVLSEVGSNDQNSVRHNSNKKEAYSHLKRLTLTAFAASAIVIVCWLPDQLYYCLFQMDLVQLGTPLHEGLVILAFLNTCLNPFLYSFSNKQYRKEFKAILCCRFRSLQRGLATQLDETKDQNLEAERTNNM